MRSLIALCFTTTTLFAEPPSQIIGLGFEDAGSDTLTITEESPVLGIIEYYNHSEMHSHNGDFRIKDGGIDCTVSVEVGDAETITVSCLDGFISEPRQVDVPDGDTFLFIVTRVSS